MLLSINTKIMYGQVTCRQTHNMKQVSIRTDYCFART